MDYWVVRSAGALAIRGTIAVLLGILALLMPGLTFMVLAIAFGIYALIDGISALIAIFDRRTQLNRGWLALEAVAGILVGIYTAFWPGVAALNLAVVIGAWAILVGIFKIISAISLRKVIRHEMLLVLSGLATIVFGAIVLYMPTVGIVGMMWAVGIYGLVVGGLLLALAIQMRGWVPLRDTGTGTGTRRAA